MTITNDQRKHQRVDHRARVQLCSSNETIVGHTKNLSDKGLFITGQFAAEPALGDCLQVQVLEIADAIPRKVIVKRIEPGIGIAVEFIGE
ncbi:MAG: PilZ domain-containing protein [Methylococcales bacterium]